MWSAAVPAWPRIPRSSLPDPWRRRYGWPGAPAGAGRGRAEAGNIAALLRADLHDLAGLEFEKAYTAYEEKARNGQIKISRTIKAVDLWRKMLGMLFETGHPWVAFKDPCNLRYTNQHAGVVHSSNLCTEITLHTNDQEIAVCNLGSVNLPKHVDENGLNMAMLEETVSTAMRMLDNVI